MPPSDAGVGTVRVLRVRPRRHPAPRSARSPSPCSSASGSSRIATPSPCHRTSAPSPRRSPPTTTSTTTTRCFSRHHGAAEFVVAAPLRTRRSGGLPGDDHARAATSSSSPCSGAARAWDPERSSWPPAMPCWCGAAGKPCATHLAGRRRRPGGGRTRPGAASGRAPRPRAPRRRSASWPGWWCSWPRVPCRRRSPALLAAGALILLHVVTHRCRPSGPSRGRRWCSSGG